MVWYTLIDDLTGKKLTDSSTPITSRAGQTVVETETRTGIWNETTRTYDPLPPRFPRITKEAFLRRLTDAELEAILIDAKTRISTEAFLFKFTALSDVRLAPAFRAELNTLESNGVIAAGRATQIFNGS